MILPIQASLERVPNSLINASHDLGANKRQTFYKVILPLALPGVIAGSIFTFLLDFRRLHHSIYHWNFKIFYWSSCIHPSRNCWKYTSSCSLFISSNLVNGDLHLLCKKNGSIRCSLEKGSINKLNQAGLRVEIWCHCRTTFSSYTFITYNSIRVYYRR